MSGGFENLFLLTKLRYLTYHRATKNEFPRNHSVYISVKHFVLAYVWL